MNSRNGRGKSSFDAGAASFDCGYPSVNGKSIEGSGHGKGSPEVDQLSRDMLDISIDPTEESEWEVIVKKPGGTGLESWGSSTTPKAWSHSEGVPRQDCGGSGGNGKSPGNSWAQATDTQRLVGRGNPKGPESEEEIISNVLPQEGSVVEYDSESAPHQPDDGSDDDDESVEDPDDDLGDDYDSDVSQKSLELRKKNRWFRAFFEAMDSLTVEEINEQTRQWHCPACHDGPGAIGWYKGLQPLMTHGKTKGSSRVKLHREFAELLEEELQRRGTSIIPAGEAFGKWKGLREPTTDLEVVWPPMVVIMNTLLKQVDNNKSLGMSNQELRQYFNEYAVVKVRHSYGPNGHRGMSVLIFEASAMGYWEAERLHKHFIANGRDRDAWKQCPMKFYPGAERQLYGYLAHRDDMGIFNQHSHGKFLLKFEMRSYQQMVVIPMKQMSEDNQTLVWLKNKVVKQQKRLKSLEETLGVVSQRLREKTEEDRIARSITKIQHDHYKDEMDSQEQFFKEQIDRVRKAMEKLQEKHAMAKQSDVNSGTKEDCCQRKETWSVKSLMRGDEDFEAGKEKLIHAYEAKKVDLKCKHLAQERELVEEFATALAKFRELHTSSASQASSSP